MATPLGPYTPAVRAGEFLFCSGQIGIDGTDLVEGLEAQIRQSMANLKSLLEEHGLGFDKVVKTTCFLVNAADYQTMNELYVEAFGDVRPARSAVAVASLPKGALFEIEAIVHAV